MAKKVKNVLACPTCKSIIKVTDPYFPFCADRCRLIDLGKWASGHYRISTLNPTDAEFEESNGPGTQGFDQGE